MANAKVQTHCSKVQEDLPECLPQQFLHLHLIPIDYPQFLQQQQQQHQQFPWNFVSCFFSGHVKVTWQREPMSCKWYRGHHLLRTCPPMERACSASSSGRSLVPQSVPLWMIHRLFPADDRTTRKRDFSGNSRGSCPSFPCERFGADSNRRSWIDAFEVLHRPLYRRQTQGLKASLRHTKKTINWRSRNYVRAAYGRPRMYARQGIGKVHT